MITKSSGFSLVELLVVVAIVGILSSISVVAYNGYVSGTKKSSAKNMMQQISLGQTEYYSDNGMYYMNSTSTNCSPTSITSTAIETNLLGGSDNINPEMGYELCISNDDSNFKITAKETGGNCQVTLTALNVIARQNC